MKVLTRTVLSLVLATTILFQMACGFNFASAANTVSDAANEAIPVVQSLIDSHTCQCSQVIARLNDVRDDSAALSTAFSSGDNTTAIAKAASVTRALETLISTDSQLLPANKRTLFLAILAAADIAIHEIAAHVQQQAPTITKSARTNADVQVMVQYAAKPKLRARSSQTGKFVSFSYAKAHPDVTQVERY